VWTRRADPPAPRGCGAGAASAVAALGRIVQKRRRLLAALWARGATIPLPREPLRGPVPAVY
jgi:hypothetical protein